MNKTGTHLKPRSVVLASAHFAKNARSKIGTGAKCLRRGDYNL
jgi:hypothetical protein